MFLCKLREADLRVDLQKEKQMCVLASYQRIITNKRTK